MTWHRCAKSVLGQNSGHQTWQQVSNQRRNRDVAQQRSAYLVRPQVSSPIPQKQNNFVSKEEILTYHFIKFLYEGWEHSSKLEHWASMCKAQSSISSTEKNYYITVVHCVCHILYSFLIYIQVIFSSVLFQTLFQRISLYIVFILDKNSRSRTARPQSTYNTNVDKQCPTDLRKSIPIYIPTNLS